jgi:hypothetical protein
MSPGGLYDLLKDNPQNNPTPKTIGQSKNGSLDKKIKLIRIAWLKKIHLNPLTRPMIFMA